MLRKIIIGLLAITFASKNLYQNDHICENVIKNEIELNEISEDSSKIYCVNPEKVFDSRIESFEFISTDTVKYVECEGTATLQTYEINNTNIICTLTNFISDDEIRLRFFFLNGSYYDYWLYFAKDYTGLFILPICL